MKLRQVLFSFLIFIAFSAIASAVPTSWAVTGNTGNYANIGFSQSGTYTINGRAMAAGDAIGAFFTRGTDQICAGYFIWGNPPYGFSVWGDNTQTPVKDGFAENETYIFKLWDNALQQEVSTPSLTLNTGFASYTINGLTTYSAFSGGTSAPLAAPTLSTPANSATGLIPCVTISWNAVATATSYYMQIATDNTFNNLVNQGVVLSTSHTQNLLAFNQTYYWRVKTKKGDTEESAWSDIRTFTTMPPLAIPTLSAPTNNTLNASTSANISWSTVPNAEYYEVHLSTYSNFASYSSLSTVNTNYDLAQLSNSTKFYWRVRAVRALAGYGNERTNWSSVYNFTTVPPPPATPGLVSPESQATNVSVNPTFTWNAVANAVSYSIQVAAVSDFSTVTVTDVVSNTTRSFIGLAAGTTYYWRVRATDGEQFGDWSEVRSFTTAGQTAPTITTLNIDVLLQSYWNNTTHKPVAVTVELRTGSSLLSSVLYKRVPVLISSNGVATAEFDDFTTGQYWVIVRSTGYLSIASKLRQTITAGSTINYDFTHSTNYVYNSAMLRLYSGRYLMKIGDLDNNKSIDGSDGILIENNTGGSTAVPSL